jgi:hypothetical protein
MIDIHLPVLWFWGFCQEALASALKAIRGSWEDSPQNGRNQIFTHTNEFRKFQPASSLHRHVSSPCFSLFLQPSAHHLFLLLNVAIFPRPGRIAYSRAATLEPGGHSDCIFIVELYLYTAAELCFIRPLERSDKPSALIKCSCCSWLGLQGGPLFLRDVLGVFPASKDFAADHQSGSTSTKSFPLNAPSISKSIPSQNIRFGSFLSYLQRSNSVCIIC